MLKGIGVSAKDYAKSMWLMLQQDEPEDFVIATENNTQSENLFN